MALFLDEMDDWLDNLIPARHALYDHVPFESDVEKQFVQDLEKREDVRLYVKLPDWFKVPTPVGEYNPDWAIVMRQRDDPDGAAGKPILYLVRETKKGQMRPTETASGFSPLTVRRYRP